MRQYILTLALFFLGSRQIAILWYQKQHEHALRASSGTRAQFNNSSNNRTSEVTVGANSVFSTGCGGYCVRTKHQLAANIQSQGCLVSSNESLSFESNDHGITIVVTVTDLLHRPCIECTIDAKLTDCPDNTDINCFTVFPEEIPHTADTGMIVTVFRMGNMAQPRTMRLLVALTSLSGVDQAIPDTRTCTYRVPGEAHVFTRAKFEQFFCTENKFVQLGIVELVSRMPAQPELPGCKQYLGSGVWDTDTQPVTHVNDSYQWREDRCKTLPLTLPQMFGENKNSVIVHLLFVGDSTLRNLFFDFALFLNGLSHTSPNDIGRTVVIAGGNQITAAFYETYGFYPVFERAHTNVTACCGEKTCAQRQRERAGKLGFVKLNHALNDMAKIPIGDHKFLILKSPAIHQGRAYVGEEEQNQIFRKLIRQVEVSSMAGKRFNVIWVSCTPTRDHHLPLELIDNRSNRRYQMHMNELTVLKSAHWILRLDVWNMTRLRRDRFYDMTHVYPSSSYAQSSRPRIIASSWSTMLKNIIWQRLSSELE